MNILSVFRLLLLGQFVRNEPKTVFQRCLALHIATASVPGGLS